MSMGFSAEFSGQEAGQQVNLVKTPWLRDMEGWDARTWAWLIALAVDKASDVLPVFGPGPENADITMKASYKLAPSRWAALHADLPGALNAILQGTDTRFRKGCLRHLRGPEVVWCSPTTDALGDPALQFDTGYMWRRAGELLCADALEDRSPKPAIRYLVGTCLVRKKMEYQTGFCPD